MSTQDWSVLVDVATLVAAVAVAVAYFSQLETMQNQLATMEKAWNWQQKYDVLTWLHDLGEDVECVLAIKQPSNDEQPSTDNWSKKEKDAASNVCTRLHIIGALLIGDEHVEQLFANVWFYSVPKCHEILQPFIEDVRAQRDPGAKRYYSGFDRLALRFPALNENYVSLTEGKSREEMRRDVLRQKQLEEARTRAV